jgi:hypothetical protein
LEGIAGFGHGQPCKQWLIRPSRRVENRGEKEMAIPCLFEMAVFLPIEH